MCRRHFEAIQRDITSERTSEWENACVHDQLHKRERERETVLELLRIKLVFTRINFNLQLNSSPQLKIKKKEEI